MESEQAPVGNLHSNAHRQQVHWRMAPSGMWIAFLIAIATLAGASAIFASGGGMQTQVARPAPAAVAPYYPYVYEGQLVLRSATVDENKSTVTLPLHRGKMKDGRAVW